jgi:hypothetical protein
MNRYECLCIRKRKWRGPHSKSISPSYGVKSWELRREAGRGNKGSETEVKNFLGERAAVTLGQAESDDGIVRGRNSFPRHDIGPEPVPQPRTLTVRTSVCNYSVYNCSAPAPMLGSSSVVSSVTPAIVPSP